MIVLFIENKTQKSPELYHPELDPGAPSQIQPTYVITPYMK